MQLSPPHLSEVQALSVAKGLNSPVSTGPPPLDSREGGNDGRGVASCLLGRGRILQPFDKLGMTGESAVATIERP